MGLARGFAALWLLSASSLACSTTATIHRMDGSRIDGWIEGGSTEAIIVQPPYGGRRGEIPRSEIAEIDHPGNVHALLGGIFLGVGIINIVAEMDECQSETADQGAVCTGMVAPAAVGAGLLIWGLAVWMGSTGAAEDTLTPRMKPVPPGPTPVPAALPPAYAVPAPAAPAPATPAPTAPAPTAPAPAPAATAPAPAPAATAPAPTAPAPTAPAPTAPAPVGPAPGVPAPAK